jgi:hypothetical protein
LPPRSSCEALRVSHPNAPIDAPYRYACSRLADLRMDANRLFVIHDCITLLTGAAARSSRCVCSAVCDSCCTGLRVLHCQHTQISAFPVGLHTLSLLEELRAHHCRLQTIDGRIGLLQHLRVLHCVANPVWSPPEDALALDTPDLKRTLAALALTQPSHAVTSHIM